MRRIALLLIKIYQYTLSFDHGPLRVFYPHGYCRFTPSCSQYTYEAVEKYGIVKGAWLGMKRIARCTPYSTPGPDPVP